MSPSNGERLLRGIVGPTKGPRSNFQGADLYWFNEEGFPPNRKMTQWPELECKARPTEAQRDAFKEVMTEWANRVMNPDQWTLCKATGNMIIKQRVDEPGSKKQKI